MNNRGYDIVIHYSPEDECFLAAVPDLPGCIADGETPSEALKALEREIDLWIDVNKKRGISIPKPSRKLEQIFA